ncbi:MAG: ComF family protein [Candidatus Ratteibacteria bacterium]
MALKKVKFLLFHHITDLVFPEKCCGCGRQTAIAKYCFCDDCINHITIAPSLHGRIFSLAIYEGPVMKAIHAFKYEKKKWIARSFAAWMHDFLIQHPEIQFDIIIPVPLHPVKEFKRSFNQSWLMAFYLGKMQRKPAIYHALVKIRNNRSQTNLTSDKRKENVEGVYRVSKIPIIKDKKILLIDDVYTTGATIEEAYRTLKRNGAREVKALTIAKA